MAYSVAMPALGESVTEGTVTRWLKNEGDTVEVDEPLVEVSTDKVDTEIPSPAAGVLQRIVVPADETVAAGIRALEDRFRGEVGVSAWNGFAVVRLCAADGAALRHDLVAVLSAAHNGSLPRLWLN